MKQKNVIVIVLVLLAAVLFLAWFMTRTGESSVVERSDNVGQIDNEQFADEDVFPDEDFADVTTGDNDENTNQANSSSDIGGTQEPDFEEDLEPQLTASQQARITALETEIANEVNADIAIAKQAELDRLRASFRAN